MEKVAEKPTEKHETAKPAPAPKVEKAKVSLISDIDDPEDTDFAYPFVDMDVDQGFFVPNESGQTTLQNAKRLSAHVAAANKLFQVVELNEDGDEVWEDVYVRTTKRNPDGSVQLDGAGKPIIGHDPVSRPNVIYSRRFIARPITKGDAFADKTADVDGVLVVRVV